MGERLQGKVAIITGASRGIGAAIACYMAEEGAKVVLVSRKIEGLEAVANEIRENGGEATPIACHAGHRNQREDMLDQALEAYGQVEQARVSREEALAGSRGFHAADSSVVVCVFQLNSVTHERRNHGAVVEEGRRAFALPGHVEGTL